MNSFSLNILPDERGSSVYCIPNATYHEFERRIVGGVSMGTSIIGFVGASLQIKNLWGYRHNLRCKPSPNPHIILYLALSDLFACLGICGLAVMMCFPKNYIDVNTETIVTLLMEVIAVFSFISSWIWTFTYALDMCFQIYEIECPMIVYKLISWLIPLDIVIWVEFANMMDDKHHEYKTCVHRHGYKSRLYLSYIIVLGTMVGNSFLFVVTYKRIKHLIKLCGTFTDEQRKVLSKFKKKFFWIVFVFASCWFPNVIFPLYKIRHTKPNSQDVVPLIFFGVEAFLNPLQGLFNYMVYRKAFKVAASETTINGTSSAFLTDINKTPEKTDENTMTTSVTPEEQTPLLIHIRNQES